MTPYEMRRCWLAYMLATYRDKPQLERGLVDKIVRISQKAAKTDPEEKQLHNLIVLRYITDTQLSVQKICAALHIGRNKPNYEAITNHAIERLMVLTFGLDGINWYGDEVNHEENTIQR